MGNALRYLWCDSPKYEQFSGSIDLKMMNEHASLDAIIDWLNHCSEKVLFWSLEDEQSL